MRSSDGADMVVANRSPRMDSWLNRLQSRGVPPDGRGRVTTSGSTTWPAASG